MGLSIVLALSAGAIAFADPPPITMSNESPVAGETVTFSTSADCVTLACTWGGDVSGTGSSVQDSFAAGSHSVTLTTSDGTTEESSTKDFTVALPPNVLPSVTLQGPSSGTKGQSLSFHAAASDSDGDIVRYEWYIDGGITSETSSDLVVSFPTAGPHVVEVYAVDDRDGKAHDRRDLTITNSAPSVSVSGPSSVFTWVTAEFTASASDPDGSIQSVVWRVDGVVQPEGGLTLARQWTDNGSHTIQVTVTDDDGATASDSTGITVLNRPPVLTVSHGPASPVLGQPVTFTASASDIDGTVASYAWKVDGVAVATTGPTLIQAFAISGSHTVSVTALDDDGAPTSAGDTVSVLANRQPTVDVSTTLPSPLTFESVTFNATGADADGHGLTYAWKLDGAPVCTAGGTSCTLSWNGSGTHQVSVTASDPFGGTGTDTTSVTVRNRAPVVTLAGPGAPIARMEVARFTATASDADGPAPTYAWKVDGAPVPGTARTLDRAFATGGPHSVSVTVTDADGATASATASVLVSKPPQVSISASSLSPLTSEPITLSAVVVDDGNPAVHSYAWTIGNKAATGTSATIAFDQPGDYPVKLTVTDEENNAVTATATVKVQNRPPVLDFVADPATIQKNEPVTFTARARDPEGHPVDNLSWDLNGDGKYDDAIGSSAQTRFSDTKVHTVGLRAVDFHGTAETLRLNFVPGNKPPASSFTASPDAPRPGDTVSLTATATDPDGTVVAHAWDLDGDGEFDDATGLTATASFAAAGPHRVALKVTDDDGGSDVASRELTAVTPEQPPVLVPQRPRASTARLMRPFPRVRVAGRLVRGGARLTLVTVTAPEGARIEVRCRGRGCPEGVVAMTARVVRITRLQGVFRTGAVLEFRVWRPRRIGRYTRIVFRDGKIPARRDLCLWPGARNPRACPGAR